MAYRAIVENIETKQRLIVFPRARKTTLFQTIEAADRALCVRGRMMGGGWRGLVYAADSETPCLYIAI